MATDLGRLTASIKSAIEGSLSIKDATRVQQLADDIANAIIIEIKAGDVTVTGVTSGSEQASGTIQ